MSEPKSEQINEQSEPSLKLYADYIKEVRGHELLSTPLGFVSYHIDGEHLHIIDVYVRPEDRASGIGFGLCEEVVEIARASGCRKILGQVDCFSLVGEQSLSAFIKMGMKILKADQDVIWLIREI